MLARENTSFLMKYFIRAMAGLFTVSFLGDKKGCRFYPYRNPPHNSLPKKIY